jgi:hypothetical protein
MTPVRAAGRADGGGPGLFPHGFRRAGGRR